MAEFKGVSDADLEAALKRGAGSAKGPKAISAKLDGRSHRIVIDLDTGISLSFDYRRAYGLRDAAREDLFGLTIEGAGSTLHIPRLDADFSIARLLEGFLGPMKWARSEARAAASRENGKRGGRPRREIVAAS